MNNNNLNIIKVALLALSAVSIYIYCADRFYGNQPDFLMDLASKNPKTTALVGAGTVGALGAGYYYNRKSSEFNTRLFANLDESYKTAVKDLLELNSNTGKTLTIKKNEANVIMTTLNQELTNAENVKKGLWWFSYLLALSSEYKSLKSEAINTLNNFIEIAFNEGKTLGDKIGNAYVKVNPRSIIPDENLPDDYYGKVVNK